MKTYYTFPKEESSLGLAQFKMAEIKQARRRGWVYKGEITNFISDDKKIKGHHLPCTLFSGTKIDTNQMYEIHGTLIKGRGPFFSFKTKEKWRPLKKTINTVKLRYEAKKWVKNYLKKTNSHPKAALFLSGLATGDLNDPVLLKQFEKKGLLHLLAISGFHFAILASFFHYAFRLFLPPKSESFILVILLSLYFIFIGNAPSVQRAWIVAIMFLVGQFFEKRGNSLNNLGLALIVSIFINPLVAFNAGFQLSFLATFGILLLFAPCEKFFWVLLPKFPFLRQGVALVISVHIALLPLLFFLFHKVPLHGIVYNLFFPFLVTIAFLLLMIASFFHLLIPPFGLLLHQCNSFYTHAILKLLEVPLIPHKTLYIENVNPWFLTTYITLFFMGSIFLRHHLEMKKNEFSFL